MILIIFNSNKLKVKDTIDELKKEVNNFLVRANTITNWTYKPTLDKWSKIEVMGHLVDSAQINLQRFVRCTYEENFKLIYEQVDWVKAQHYQEAAMEDVLLLWKLLNYQIIRVLENYPAVRFIAKCDNSKNDVDLHTVEWLTQDYVAHLKHHLKEV